MLSPSCEESLQCWRKAPVLWQSCEAPSAAATPSMLLPSCEGRLPYFRTGRSHDEAFSAAAELPVWSPSCEAFWAPAEFPVLLHRCKGKPPVLSQSSKCGRKAVKKAFAAVAKLPVLP